VRRFLTRHWVWLHVAVFVLVPAFLALGWWQVLRAGAGNARSYGYAVEWPSLAAIGVFLYIRAIRLELRNPAGPPVPTPDIEQQINAVTYGAAIALAEEDDPELAAYNEYLSGLHARDLQNRR
jgi:DNA-binding transcriptional regulator of glucitol operon